jgi:hypothetical protein
MSDVKEDHAALAVAELLESFKKCPEPKGTKVGYIQKLPTKDDAVRAKALLDGEKFVEVKHNGSDTLMVFYTVNEKPKPKVKKNK